VGYARAADTMRSMGAMGRWRYRDIVDDNVLGWEGEAITASIDLKRLLALLFGVGQLLLLWYRRCRCCSCWYHRCRRSVRALGCATLVLLVAFRD